MQNLQSTHSGQFSVISWSLLINTSGSVFFQLLIRLNWICTTERLSSICKRFYLRGKTASPVLPVLLYILFQSLSLTESTISWPSCSISVVLSVRPPSHFSVQPIIWFPPLLPSLSLIHPPPSSLSIRFCILLRFQENL